MNALQQTPASFASTGSYVHSSRLNPFGDRYVNVCRIGGGGIADVFRCFDREHSRWIALKTLNPITCRRLEDRERFLNEPILMQAIGHAAIPSVFGSFRCEEPAPYFTMEYVDGHNLCRILSGLRASDPQFCDLFPLGRLVGIVASACEGLAAAHDQGVLHRDVKPENIMVDSAGNTRIIDWGVAKSTRESDGATKGERAQLVHDRRWKRRLTQAGYQPGTLLYMSPEQAVGLTQLDERTDVYSLGAVLYDCLALTTFIDGESTEEIVQRITSGPQVPPSDVNIRPCGVPARLESACMQALSIDPRKRFNDLLEFRSAILEFASV